MNIIFLTLARITDINQREIYSDLIRKFRDEGHTVYLVTPSERRFRKVTSLYESDGVRILSVKTLKIQKTNIIEKGIGTLLLERQYKVAIKKYLKGIQFDLITYSTPPITFTNVVKYLKKQNPKAISYLQLKDIFPQNAVDIGMFTKSSLFYKFFRKKEVELYKNSDFIGCMSPANVEYVRKHNPFYPTNRVEVAPNCVDLQTQEKEVDKRAIREKYGVPVNKPVFIYGGNLGKPQGIDFLIKCLDDNKTRQDCYFLVVGNGTEYHKLEAWMNDVQNKLDDVNKLSVKLISRLPKQDYDQLVKACDVGLIFLDHRFTIPNYPSRLLTYLEYKMPVICATDSNTDIGRIAERNGYGYWCESNRSIDFNVLLNKMLGKPGSIKEMGERGYDYLCKNYQVDNIYRVIMNHF